MVYNHWAMWYCSSDGGHWVEGAPDYCPEHDNRLLHRLGRLAVVLGLLLVLLLAVSGLWTECTVTDPEYWSYR